MSRGHKVPTAREAAERKILARQLATLDTRCNHLTEAARVLIGPADDLGKVATLAAHIVTGETDMHKVAQVAVRLAQRLAMAQTTLKRTEDELVRQQNFVRDLRNEYTRERTGG